MLPTEQDRPIEVVYRYPKAENLKRLMNADQVATILQIRRKTVYEYAKRGEIKAFRQGHMVLFHPDDVEEFVKSRIS